MVLLTDANSIVLDSDFDYCDALRAILEPCEHKDRRVSVRELDCVREKVQQHLLQTLLVKVVELMLGERDKLGSDLDQSQLCLCLH